MFPPLNQALVSNWQFQIKAMLALEAGEWLSASGSAKTLCSSTCSRMHKRSRISVFMSGLLCQTRNTWSPKDNKYRFFVWSLCTGDTAKGLMGTLSNTMTTEILAKQIQLSSAPESGNRGFEGIDEPDLNDVVAVTPDDTLSTTRRRGTAYETVFIRSFLPIFRYYVGRRHWSWT
jgi:hypothetical protein